MVGACDSIGTLMTMFYDAENLSGEVKLENKSLFSSKTDNVAHIIRSFLLQ